jgi:uncharacterized protein (TIGR03437 family)
LEEAPLKPGFIIFTLSLAAAVSAQPVIRSSDGILNASGYQAQLAPDTVFDIFGTGLGPATLQAASQPYQASFGGTSISFTPTGGGTAIAAKIVYTLATQVAGVLPSSITPGTYAVSVTYQGQPSQPQNVTVVARSLGIATSNSGGTGAAQATIGNVNNGVSLVRMTAGSVSFGGYNWPLGPAQPGDEIVLWGTGGGADPENDTGGSSGDQTAAGNFTVSVDGTQIVPVYSGTSSGYEGLWQVNFVLPPNIAADCFAYVTVTGGGQTSNGVTIAIAATGQTSCSTGIPASTLSKLDSGTGTITLGGLVIGKNIINGAVSYEIGGVINQYTAAEFLIPYGATKVGYCYFLNETYPVTGKEPSAPDSQLDAGSITLSGPGAGTNQTLAREGNFYTGTLNSITLGGSYTLTASGGSQVGPFSVTSAFPTAFTVTNLSSLTNVNRAQPLTVNWTGSGFDTVEIQINTTTETSTTVFGSDLNCAVPASLGTYTIPASVLANLSPSANTLLQVSADNTGGFPASAESTMDPNTVIPLVSGGLVDFGGFGGYIDYAITASVQ